jgi:hypothetical protein
MWAADTPSGWCRSPGASNVVANVRVPRRRDPQQRDLRSPNDNDNGDGVVAVRTVKCEAVVQPSRRLMEHLRSCFDVHLGSCLSGCIWGCQELIERWPTVRCGTPQGSRYAHDPAQANMSLGLPRPEDQALRPTVRRLLPRTTTASTAPHDSYDPAHGREDTVAPER